MSEALDLLATITPEATPRSKSVGVSETVACACFRMRTTSAGPITPNGSRSGTTPPFMRAFNVVTPFAVYHGSEARNTLASSLADCLATLLGGRGACAPRPVRGSSGHFHASAHSHCPDDDEFVRAESAARLNQKGSSRVFQKVGDKVKVRVPPTQVQSWRPTGEPSTRPPGGAHAPSWNA